MYSQFVMASVDKLSIATINTRGLNNTKKRVSLFNWIKENNIGITIIQETFCTKNFVSTFNIQWDGAIYHSCTDSKHTRGVCILISKAISCNVLNSVTDDKGRALLINLE